MSSTVFDFHIVFAVITVTFLVLDQLNSSMLIHYVSKNKPTLQAVVLSSMD